jgi:Holliday junction resolvase-like predicted endonuclease
MPLPDLEFLLQRNKYEGLPANESEVAREWLRAHGAEWDEARWNYRLGEGLILDESWPEEQRRAAWLSGQRRADLVVLRGDATAIVEFKVRAGFGVLGQLLGYADLWRQEHPAGPEPRMIVACARIDLDGRRVLEAQGVEVEAFAAVAALI